jgi:uncharacterized peroxidase-related enzyme
MVQCVSHIDIVDEDHAEGELFQMYDELQRTRGRVSNVMRVQSLHPKGMRRHLDMYMELLYGKGPLERLERELIGVVASAANGCEYCVVHHADALQKYAKDKVWVARVRNDYLDAEMTPKQRALADFAFGLTKEPQNGSKERVAALRAAGYDDAAILHATEVVAYFNFVNRLVHGLGVDLEEDPHQDFLY